MDDANDFVVPEDIAAEAVARVDAAGIDVESLTIPMSAAEVRDVVPTSLANVGPEFLSNVFGELLGGTLTAAALHGGVNAFLVYKGAKERSRLLEDTAYSTGVSTGELAAAFATEATFHKLVGSVAILGGPATFASDIRR